ncbi:MAG: ABC transporter permease, partial [Termitinemataceae bacterium]
MNKLQWIPFVAGRYLSISKKRRQSSVRTSSLLSVLGIASGVFVLIIVIGVMNGFQLGFIESILQISSYHIRIEVPLSLVQDRAAFESLLSELRSETISKAAPAQEIQALLPFLEFQALIKGPRRNTQVALIRGVPADARVLDPGLEHALSIIAGSFNFDQHNSIVIGSELARSLGLRLGDSVSLLSIAGDLFQEASPEQDTFVVSGIFRSNFYEFDTSWVFISLDRAVRMERQPKGLEIGIKLKDRDKDLLVRRELEARLEKKLNERFKDQGLTFSSWREYNRAFFGALRTEKMLMFFLVALIFVVVSLNIFQSQRRNVLERREEIGLLRALGASNQAVHGIFTLDGILIGVTGSTLGLIPALIIGSNITTFFSILETLINTLLLYINKCLAFFNPSIAQNGVSGAFQFFSPQVFYLKEIPCRLIPMEVITIYLFGLLSATVAAALAASSVSK